MSEGQAAPQAAVSLPLAAGEPLPAKEIERILSSPASDVIAVVEGYTYPEQFSRENNGWFIWRANIDGLLPVTVTVRAAKP